MKRKDIVDPYDMHTAHASTPDETYLQAFGQGVVHYKAHIWLVNAHPKGNGCTYHLQATTLPFPLHLDALFRGHASMVMVCLKLTTFLQCTKCMLTASLQTVPCTHAHLEHCCFEGITAG